MAIKGYKAQVTIADDADTTTWNGFDQVRLLKFIRGNFVMLHHPSGNRILRKAGKSLILYNRTNRHIPPKEYLVEDIEVDLIILMAVMN